MSLEENTVFGFLSEIMRQLEAFGIHIVSTLWLTLHFLEPLVPGRHFPVSELPERSTSFFGTTGS